MGPIAKEVVRHIEPTLTAMPSDVSALVQQVQLNDRKAASNTEHINNLMEEHKSLRSAISNRATYGDKAFDGAQVGATQSTKLDLSAMMGAANGKGPTRPSGGSSQRTVITMEELRKAAPAWATMIETLLTQHKRTMDDPCVVCLRGNSATGFIPPQRAHPTK